MNQDILKMLREQSAVQLEAVLARPRPANSWRAYTELYISQELAHDIEIPVPADYPADRMLKIRSIWHPERREIESTMVLALGNPQENEWVPIGTLQL